MNLFSQASVARGEELCEPLLEKATLRIERIVSHAHASPEGFWYDQDRDEWVCLLQGAARLRLENDAAAIELRRGDSIHLPAHCRHRVEWTSPDELTIWLAVHWDNAAGHL